MARPKGGLGRGLDSLFADLPQPDSAEENAVTTLPLREIEPDPGQPRKNFDEQALSQLAQSITENGLLQPIAVRPKKAGPGYVIIAGERRWRACRMAGLAEAPVIIREVTDEQAAALALIENLQREDLDPLEAAEGYRQLMDKYNLTQEMVARRLGKSRSAIANSLRLLALPESVRDQVRRGVLSSGHAKALLSLPDAESMTKAAAQVEAKNLNVRQTEALCRKLTRPAAPEPPKPDEFDRPAIAVEVEAALRQSAGTEVRVEYREGRGTLSIDFYSDAQLTRFAKLLGLYDPERDNDDQYTVPSFPN
ncbi:MAG: ParB/RepB/Spo0J family partition protein [Gemmiger sp.]